MGDTADPSEERIAEVAALRQALLKAAENHRETVEARVQLEREREARKISDLARIEILRRDTRFRRLINSNLIGILVATENELVEANDAFLKIVGYTRDDLEEVKRQWRHMTPKEYLSLDQRAITEILERNECTAYEKAFLRKDGSLVFVLIGCVKIEAADLSWICYVIDLTAQKQAEIDLRASEERYRALAEAMSSIVWTTTADGFTTDIPQWRALTGQTQEQCAGWGWLDALHPNDRQRVDEAWQASVRQRTLYDVEYRIRNREGGYHWFNARGVPVFNRDGTVREWVGVCIDIGGRKAAEERQILLMAELDHRVRNILASIQAMVSLTAQGARTKEEYSKRLHGRIEAMARTHGLLTKQKWKGASLRRLVQDELAAFGSDAAAVLITGEPEDLFLQPKTALNLSLVLHELSTNAAKYGALADPEGRVAVTWQTSKEDSGSRLILEWRETDGPPVAKPTRVGFGSTLIRSALSAERDADVALDFDPGGVRCRIKLRLAPPSASSGTDADAAIRELLKSPNEDTPKGSCGRVLVAEDEPLVALELISILTSAGVGVIGPTMTVSGTLAVIDHVVVDAAALDINLKGEMIYPVADKLIERGVPIVFVTGYEPTPHLPDRYRHVPTLQKPIEPAALLDRIHVLLSLAAKAGSLSRCQSGT